MIANLPKLSFIKYTGSKRYLVKQIEALMPKKFDTYYEPFLGSGIMLTTAAEKCNKMVGSDIFKELMELWNLVKTNPSKIISHYTELWLQGSANVYYDVRKRFNTSRNPLDFYFLTRTSINGLIRFNPRGEFNASFHHAGRDGMKPEKIETLITDWNIFLTKYNTEFLYASFEHILDKVTKNDFVFLDPPYKNSLGRMYEKHIGPEDIENLLNELNKKECKWLLTYDGKVSGTDITYEFNKNLYKTHGYFESAKSRWQTRRDVQESFYMNY